MKKAAQTFHIPTISENNGQAPSSLDSVETRKLVLKRVHYPTMGSKTELTETLIMEYCIGLSPHPDTLYSDPAR